MHLHLRISVLYLVERGVHRVILVQIVLWLTWHSDIKIIRISGDNMSDILYDLYGQAIYKLNLGE